jgi:hypothetical protein
MFLAQSQTAKANPAQPPRRKAPSSYIIGPIVAIITLVLLDEISPAKFGPVRRTLSDMLTHTEPFDAGDDDRRSTQDVRSHVLCLIDSINILCRRLRQMRLWTVGELSTDGLTFALGPVEWT